MAAATVLSVRFDDDMLVLIDAAVVRAGTAAGREMTRSEWAREVLAAAASGGKTVQPHPRRALQLQSRSRQQLVTRPNRAIPPDF